MLGWVKSTMNYTDRKKQSINVNSERFIVKRDKVSLRYYDVKKSNQ